MYRIFILIVGVISVAFAAVSNTPKSVNDTASPKAINEQTAISLATPEESPEQSQELQITNAWAKESYSAGGNGAVYLKINNPTDKTYNIVGVSAIEVANNTELHATFIDEGKAKMENLAKITIPANAEIVLEPTKTHIMLFGLKKNLKKDDVFKIDIKIQEVKFNQDGAMATPVEIKTIPVTVRSEAP